MASFPIRHGITVLGPDDPNKKKICPPIYVEEGFEHMIRIFPKEEDREIIKYKEPPDPKDFIKSRFEILDL